MYGRGSIVILSILTFVALALLWQWHEEKTENKFLKGSLMFYIYLERLAVNLENNYIFCLFILEIFIKIMKQYFRSCS